MIKIKDFTLASKNWGCTCLPWFLGADAHAYVQIFLITLLNA